MAEGISIGGFCGVKKFVHVLIEQNDLLAKVFRYVSLIVFIAAERNVALPFHPSHILSYL